MKLITETVIVSAISVFPFLGIPIIKQLFSLGVKWIFSFIDTHLTDTINFSIIDSKIESQRIAYDNAVQELKDTIEIVEGSGKDEIGEGLIEDARLEFEARARALIRLRK